LWVSVHRSGQYHRRASINDIVIFPRRQPFPRPMLHRQSSILCDKQVHRPRDTPVIVNDDRKQSSRGEGCVFRRNAPSLHSQLNCFMTPRVSPSPSPPRPSHPVGSEMIAVGFDGCKLHESHLLAGRIHGYSLRSTNGKGRVATRGTHKLQVTALDAPRVVLTIATPVIYYSSSLWYVFLAKSQLGVRAN
jgi:hypothetical protein